MITTTKNKVNQFANCSHCGKEFLQNRSDKKFCKASCRSSNWKMNSDKTKSLGILKKSSLVGGQYKKSGNEIIGDLAISSAPVLMDNIFKKLSGNHNSDLSKKIDNLIQLNLKVIQLLESSTLPKDKVKEIIALQKNSIR